MKTTLGSQLHLRELPPEIVSAMQEEAKRVGVTQRSYVAAAIRHYLTVTKKMADVDSAELRRLP